MIAAAVLATAAAAAPIPAQAAGTALAACTAHAAGTVPIDAAHADPLARAGLSVEAQPLAPFARMAATPYGTGSFARAPSAEGTVYAVGYDRGACVVMVVGTAVEPVEQALAATFAAPGGWQAEPIRQLDADSRWTQYGRRAGGHELTAQMKVQPLRTTPARGLVMVTVAPDVKKN